MLKTVLSGNLDQVIKQRNGFLLLATGMLISNILLSCSALNKREKTILVPTILRETVWNEAELFSASYIEQMTMSFADSLLNTTPAAAKFRRDFILHYTDPARYGELEKKLLDEEQRMQEENITTIFFPQKVEALSNLHSKITGILSTYVAGTKIEQKQVSYEFIFAFEGSRWFLKDFKRIGKDEK